MMTMMMMIAKDTEVIEDQWKHISIPERVHTEMTLKQLSRLHYISRQLAH